MSNARELLGSESASSLLDADDVAAAIEACLNASQACTSCADLCLAEDDVTALSACVGLDQTCADVCGMTMRVLSRPVRSDHLIVHRLLQACVRACASCAEECARHADHHRHCAICSKACRACERACAALLEAEAFAELQNLAGG